MSDQQWGQQPHDPNTPQAPAQPPGQGGQQPYPSGQQPYPSGQQPYPAGQQPYPQAAPAYGQAPAAQAGYAAARPPIPGPAALAVKLMYVGAALSALGVLSSLFMQDQMREQIEGQPGVTPDMVDTFMTVGLVLGVVFGLVGVGLWVLNAVFNAKGKNWARILSTVLGGLSVVFTLLGITQPAPAVSRILSVLTLLLAVTIVVLLWRPENKAFYAPAPTGY